ncbi:MAG: non-canonical purine NTP pyrophosphatase [Hyphomicrobium sp.]
MTGDDRNKLSPGTRLVVASHNKGKVWEIHQLIVPYGLDAISAGDLGLAEPEETESTFAGNARLKALAAANGSGLPALADDSGLEVDCLGGAPGIFSARWAGPTKDFGLAMAKVADEVARRDGWPAPDSRDEGPRANFISVLCLAWPDGETQIFEGKVHGHLVWPARGGNGFGYDPMFVADAETLTYGEMEPKQKYANSHRTRAFAAFKAACLDGLDLTDAPPNSVRDAAGLAAAAANISTQAELAAFIAGLRAELANDGATLPQFLACLEAVTRDTHFQAEPIWRTIAKALLAASLKK